MSAIAPVPQRADAERNRRRILDAASRVFAERGPGATLADVARAAGVGVGTVYRKFADKQELLDALLDDKVETFMRVVREAAEVADPGEAFRRYLGGIIAVHAADRSLATVLFSPHRQERVPAGVADELGATADRLIDAAVAVGELRPGFTRQDTIVLATAVGAIAVATRPLDPELWRRYAQIVIDGTRVGPGTAELTPPVPAFRATAEALGRAL